MEMCYILRESFDHVGDSGYDAECLNVKGGEDGIGPDMMDIDDFDAPKELFYLADFDNIPQYDYPVTDLTVPIISHKMLNVLKSVGNFEYKLIPVTMIDHCYLGKQFDGNGNLKGDVPNNRDYYAIQIKEYTDAFDIEMSDYDEDEIFGKPVGLIRKLILKEPNEGFPPLFKIKEDFSFLLISKDAKEALELAGIKGCEFEEVEVSQA